MAANVNAPFGFRQYRGNGSAPTYEQVATQIQYNAGAIYYGDPVTWQTDGTIAQSSSTGATPAALGIAGIFVGCEYLSVATKRKQWSNYWPGSDVASGNYVTGYIVNDPNSLWIAQSDSTGLAWPTDQNATIGFVIGTGTAANGLSGAYLDSTTLNTSTYDVDAPFKVIQIFGGNSAQAPAGIPGSYQNGQAYDYAVVMFNNIVTRNFKGA